MTCNDVELNASCLQIRKAARRLEHLLREGKMEDLSDALAVIRVEAREAGYIAEKLK